MSQVIQEHIAKFPNPQDAMKNEKEIDIKMENFDDAIKKVKSSREGKPVEKIKVPYYRWQSLTEISSLVHIDKL